MVDAGWVQSASFPTMSVRSAGCDRDLVTEDLGEMVDGGRLLTAVEVSSSSSSSSSSSLLDSSEY